MKNLVEELHKLGDDEYQVSPDFSKNVMKKIRSAKKVNRINYVISFASLGAVACMAFVALKISDYSINQISYDEEESVKSSFNDSITVNESVAMNSFVMQDEFDNYREPFYDLELEKSHKIENVLLSDVETLLKKEKLEYSVFENTIKVKASKEAILNILKDIDNITIEVQEEYVIIKF